ncbi:hypothetical protein Y1Q_0012551 [Alligator mississippiensis]|uniref:Uncharacterized protein n=1 Tax=Alligator mississippiensis TaxID=8496 RepID=A0A151M819_ALLMI|nr:hypothetical protein Y1Q_0012551 [Alligator mississippiensis]
MVGYIIPLQHTMDKDIYLFGGTYESTDGNKTPKNDIMKLSLAKMKWKIPLYIGIPPARRWSHVAFFFIAISISLVE